jgi:amidase
MVDTRWMDATAQAELVRSGRASARELLEEALARIDEVNPALNAVIHPLTERAIAAVDRGLPDGPFTGVPMLLKDLAQELAGEPLHEGMRFLRDAGHRADVTSELAARFERAGLVICGKTNTPELGGLPTTEPLAYGPSRNPWDLDRTPGGSSGGSAAAVAAGVVAVGHANDAGGSIRNPAARCGLVGLKPSRGRIPLGPHYGDLFGGLVSELAVTRSVRDTAGLLDAVGGPAPGDPYHPPPGPPSWLDALDRPPGRLRVGFWTGIPGGRTELSAASRTAVEETATVLAELGHDVVEAHPLALDGPEAGLVLADLVMAGTEWAIRRWERITGVTARDEQLEPVTRVYREQAAKLDGADVLERIERGQLLTRAVDDWYGGTEAGSVDRRTGFDLLVMAVVAEPPNPLGELQAETDGEVPDAFKAVLPSLWLTCWANVTGQPAMSVPIHWDGGLPIGVQLVGRLGREDLLLAVAAQLEEARPWADRHPPTVTTVQHI